METSYNTSLGSVICGDSLDVLRTYDDNSVDLIITSPPYALLTKKEYGNVSAQEYLDWFTPFASEFYRILKDSGSFVLDIGGAWNKGEPTRSIYQFELMVSIVRDHNFHLAQEFYWANPSRPPAPAEWTTVRRIRIKDIVDTVWWFSKTAWPKSDNRKILLPYSDSQKHILKNGKNLDRVAPSGYDITSNMMKDNGGSITSNLLIMSNGRSEKKYIQYCNDNNLEVHPARFPVDLPEFFIRFLTNYEDLVIDPFGGACTTGIAAELLNRRWSCIELNEEYINGGIFRLQNIQDYQHKGKFKQYSIPHPLAYATGVAEHTIGADGGKDYHKHGRSESVMVTQKFKPAQPLQQSMFN